METVGFVEIQVVFGQVIAENSFFFRMYKR